MSKISLGRRGDFLGSGAKIVNGLLSVCLHAGKATEVGRAGLRLQVADGVIICHVPSVPLSQVSLRLWCGADPA